VARLDIQCDACELVIRDIQIPGDQIGKEGKVKKECPDCKNRSFHTYWGGGEAPSVATIGNDKEKIFDDCKTVGEFWDKTNVKLGSKEYDKASKNRIRKMRDKAVKNAKPNKSS
jgi:hypothetical protein